MPGRSNQAETKIDSSAATAALWELEEIFRAPITLFYIESHSYKEIAEILDLPMGTVMSRISRGKEQLRQKLQNASSATNKVVPMPGTKGFQHG